MWVKGHSEGDCGQPAILPVDVELWYQQVGPCTVPDQLSVAGGAAKAIPFVFKMPFIQFHRMAYF